MSANEVGKRQGLSRPVRRAAAAVAAAALGLVAGSAAAGGLGAVVLLVNPAFDIATRKALFVSPIPLIAEGMLWALLGGAMFIFPVAVVVLALVQPRNSHGRALAIAVVLLLPIFVFHFPRRLSRTILFAIPVWLGVRVSLWALARLARRS
jgi:hypothetical protein